MCICFTLGIKTENGADLSNHSPGINYDNFWNLPDQLVIFRAKCEKLMEIRRISGPEQGLIDFFQNLPLWIDLPLWIGGCMME